MVKQDFSVFNQPFDSLLSGQGDSKHAETNF
jgi:hypothetical protein